MSKKTSSIKHKIHFFVLLITLTCSVVFTIYHYMSEREVIITSLDNKLTAAANAVPYILAEDFHDRAVDAEAITSEEHVKDVNLLSEYMNNVKEIKYIYSYVKVGDDYYCTSSSATRKELADKSYDTYYEKYEPTEGMVIAFKTNQVVFEEDTDEYGYFRSVLIPLITKGGRTYVIGADIPMKIVQSHLRSLLVKSSIIGIVFFILSFVISIFLANKFVDPIVKLTECTRDVVFKGFDFATISTDALDEIGRTSNDEIGILAKTIKHMEQELQLYITNLTETTAAKERIESELKIAHDIQMSLLPRAFPGAPSIPELEMHAMLEPAKQVGGDLYDSFVIDDERVFFAIGDVSDKGVPAALFMAVTKALFRAYGQKDLSLGEVVKSVNDELSRDNTSQMFVTMFCCIINIKTGEIEFCDGGHENPFIIYSNDTVEMVEKKGGMALGFMPDIPYESETIHLEPGDTFFLYTDGVNEAMNKERKQFSVPYLKECLENICKESPKEITRHIMELVHQHAGNEPQSDDITIFAIQFKGSGDAR